MESECPAVQRIVKESGLYPAIENYVATDTVTANCFLERFYAETDTMHFPFGEMAIIPDDVQRIIGLKVLGNPVKVADDSKELEWDKIYELTEKMFGWNKETTLANLYKTKTSQTKTITFVKLKSLFGDTKDKVLTPEEVDQTAAAYMLFILGSAIFPDSNGNRVHMSHLRFLDPLNKVHEYSWGTAFLAHFLAEMRRASKAKTRQFNGNFTVIQVW